MPERPKLTRRRVCHSLACLAVALWAILLGPARASLAAERVVCASYPVFLFTRFLNDGRDLFQVELLTNPAAGCPHEFAPTPRDLERLTQTGILVKNGLGLEPYLDRALRVAPPDIEVIDASQGIPPLSIIWGRVDVDGSMAPWPDGRQPAMIPNPHAFLSPKFSLAMVGNIARALTRLDPGGADHYAGRLAEWELMTQGLEELLGRFRETHRGYKLITSHGFMDYLARDLGLAVLADLSPMGTESPPSAQRLSLLGRLVEQEKIAAILLDPEADPAAARTLGREANVPAAIIDSAASGPPDPPLDFFQRVIREDIELLGKLLPANVQPPPPPPRPVPAPSDPRPVEAPALD
ncbi:MAG: metal ABC transporter substrate-binding protein [Deltaproteobacteria bacterium]|jgi:zinc/manganese transport system substrate-binding protein/zinc transport system substrate-binding protein|nr:metal ABC transporter substrate-binding protein [Deltaproteobacteria bacterium]